MPSAIQSLLDDESFQNLSGSLRSFNLFSAVDAVYLERHHSALLRFLLDRNEVHGLESAFFDRLMDRVIGAESPKRARFYPSARMLVTRETDRVDIRVVDLDNRFVVIVENKIRSKEHSDQLDRYWRKTVLRFQPPKYEMFGLYLTPTGEPPESRKSPYLPVGYALVADTIDEVIAERNPRCDVKMLMTHYAAILRSHIVGDSKRYRAIYREHKQAIDLIYRHSQPDRGKWTDVVTTLVQQQNLQLVLAEHGVPRDGLVYFRPARWSEPLRNVEVRGRTRGGLIFFQFDMRRMLGQSLNLGLYVDLRAADVRQQLYRYLENHRDDIRVLEPGSSENDFLPLYELSIIDDDFFFSHSDQEIEQYIQETWDRFAMDELQVILRELNLNEVLKS